MRKDNNSFGIRFGLVLVFAVCGWGQTKTPGSPAATIVISTAGGVLSGTYTSGITATGTTGQTCILGTFNGGGTLAAATVALTGTNAIAGSTALVITAAGSGYSTLPTSATATSGTATCSGTATIVTVVRILPRSPGHYFNSTAIAVTYPLPAIASGFTGQKLCFRNYATRTGVITLKAPASTFIDKAGAVGIAGGTLVSGGALGDAACVMAIDSTHYAAYPELGTWTNN